MGCHSADVCQRVRPDKLRYFRFAKRVQDQDDTFFAPRKSRSDAIQVMALFDASLLVSLSMAIGREMGGPDGWGSRNELRHLWHIKHTNSYHACDHRDFQHHPRKLSTNQYFNHGGSCTGQRFFTMVVTLMAGAFLLCETMRGIQMAFFQVSGCLFGELPPGRGWQSWECCGTACRNDACVAAQGDSPHESSGHIACGPGGIDIPPANCTW